MNEGKTLLLVEDEAIIALAEKLLLNKAGYDVVHVTTGEKAIEVIRDEERRIDLILMDIDLGSTMDGTEAATRILEIRDIPLVFLSSHTEKEYTDRTEQISSYGYILKNSGETVLLASIRMAFKLFEANTARRRSEERFRTIVEQAPEPIFIRTEYHFAYLNPAALRLLGANTPEELVGQPVIDRVDPSFQDIARERIRILNNDRIPLRSASEQKWKRLDGSEIWVETVGEPYEYDGHPGALVFIRDRTEQKRQAETTEWWHRLVQYVLRHDPNSVAILDDGLHFMYVSDRYIRDYRLTDHDIIGRHHYEVFPDIPERWRKVHQRALAGEVLSSDNDSFHRTDGSIDYTRWECRPWYQVDGSVGGIILYTEVLTDRRRDQERFRLLAENARDMIYRIDLVPERRFSYVSPAATEITGYTPEEHYADPDLGFKLVHPDDRERLQELTRGDNAFESVLTFRWRRKDGTTIWTEQKNVPVYDNEGRLIAIEGIARDITESKLMEERLSDQKDRDGTQR